MNENVKKGLITLLLLAVGVGFGRYLTPAQVSIKTETVEVEKVVTVEKVVYVKEEVRKTDSKKIVETKKVTKPDGTVIEETKESNQDTTFSDNSEKVASEKSSTKEETKINKKDVEKKYDTKKAHVSLLAGLSTENLFKSPTIIYGMHASYSFFGPISVGVFGTSTKELGVSAGLDF